MHFKGIDAGHRASICVRACEGLPASLLEMPGYTVKAELDSLDAQIEMRIKAEAVGGYCEWTSPGWSYTSGCGVAGNMSTYTYCPYCGKKIRVSSVLG